MKTTTTLVNRHLAILVTALLLWSAQAHAQNLVQNPGFETGNFTDWTVTGSGTVETGNATYPAHSGNSAADFGYSLPTIISQTITSVPGDSYAFDFWLSFDGSGGPPVSFFASWNGGQIFSTVGTGSLPYTQEVFTETATGTSTAVIFAGAGFDADQWVLDDVSVTDLTAAGVPDGGSTLFLLSLGLAALARIGRKRLPSS